MIILSETHTQRSTGSCAGTYRGGARRDNALGAESPNSDATNFFNTAHLLPKKLGVEHGGAKLVSYPGRHPVPSPRGTLVALAPKTKIQSPPNWNMKHYKAVEFYHFQNVKTHCTNVRPTFEDFLATVLHFTSVRPWSCGQMFLGYKSFRSAKRDPTVPAHRPTEISNFRKHVFHIFLPYLSRQDETAK